MNKLKKTAIALSLCITLTLTTTSIQAAESLITLLPYPLEQQADNESTITLQQAFNLARRNNSSIDALHDSMVLIDQQRTSLTVDYDNAWRFGQGLTDLTAAQAMRGLRSLDLNAGNMGYHRQMLESISSFLVLNSVNTIRGIEIDMILLSEAIELQTIEYNHTRLRNSLGMASETDVASAHQDLQRNRALLRTLQISLDGQRAALNNLLGLPSDAEVRVANDINLEPQSVYVRVRNLNNYIRRQTDTDPSLAILRRALNTAQANYDTTQPWLQNTLRPQIVGQPFNRHANETDRMSMENAVTTASRELRDATDALQENMRQTFNQLRQLEEQRETLLIDLRRARDTYNNATASLAAGMITQHELNAARIAIMNAEADIIRNALNYENLLFAFESPFLLAR